MAQEPAETSQELQEQPNWRDQKLDPTAPIFTSAVNATDEVQSRIDAIVNAAPVNTTSYLPAPRGKYIGYYVRDDKPSK